MIEIKSRWDDKVLYTAENAQDVRQAVEEAVQKGANLGGANLGEAHLGGANLGDAYLGGANLGGANLGGANLGDAHLGGANLGDAYLGGAYLGGAYLGDANLGGAYLGGANLGDAYLGGAADWDHPFWSTRQDMFTILDQAPTEVAALRDAMAAGKINGSTYSDGECGCLCGTIGIVHAGEAGEGAVDQAIRDLGIKPDGSRPAEQWIVKVELGDKPLDVSDESIDWKEQSESVFRLSWALKWIDEWLESRTAIAKALAGGGE